MPEKSSSMALHLVPLRQIVSQIGSWLFWPSCLTSNLSGSTCFSPLQCWGQSPPPTMFNPFYVFFEHRLWEFELRTSYLHSEHSSPLNYLPNPSLGPLEGMVGYLRTYGNLNPTNNCFCRTKGFNILLTDITGNLVYSVTFKSAAYPKTSYLLNKCSFSSETDL